MQTTINMPFITAFSAKNNDSENIIGTKKHVTKFHGILGMSPEDESAGELLLKWMKKNNKLDKYMFSVLPGNGVKNTSAGYMTFGNY